MRGTNEKGFTLIELVLAITIMGIIAGATVTLLSMHLKAHNIASDRSGLHMEGLLAMDRMTNAARKATFLLIPNAHNTTRDILAFSGTINEDNDNYFNDPLFPRIDEDPKKQMTDDDTAGIKAIDDDGDASIDEGDMNDDDEDGLIDEDGFDGVDNDADGNIDEDTYDDANIPDMDDDADGSVDEGDIKDDDEDGLVNEDHLNPFIYSFDSGTNTLTETSTFDSTTSNLSTHVTNFSAKYKSPGLIQFTLELTGDDGKVVTFTENVYVENVLQKIGKRVR